MLNIDEIKNTILQGDSLEVLKQIPDNSINCCISSPPYWGLRDYGVDGQLGLEKKPEEFISKLVDVFREVRRVLREDGTCWVNLGDSYAASSKGSGGQSDKQDSNTGSRYDPYKFDLKACNLKPKDIVGIPWMFAFAARKDGWYLRQEIIWHKPNPMPESVNDRCTKAHESIFLLTKSARYWYDNEAIKEEAACKEGTEGSFFRNGDCRKARLAGKNQTSGNELNYVERKEDGTRNKRSVWTVPTYPYSEAHFATFPEKLIEPCVLAGCPENGIILDPFFGAGTTGLVAYKNRRDYVGIELNPKYIDIAENRIQQEKDKLAIFAGDTNV